MLIVCAVLQIDACLDWMQVTAGQVMWRPQDVSDSFYIVINGRLRAITEGDNGKVTITGEYGQGDTVGELDVITNSPRRTTLHAIRDSELIRMPQTLFNAISSRYVQNRLGNFAILTSSCSNPRTTAQYVSIQMTSITLFRHTCKAFTYHCITCT